MKEHSLSTGSFDCVEPIFFHFNGVVTSQIDYILTSDPDLFYKYSALQKDACHASSHVPVQAQIKLPAFMVENNDSTVIQTKLIPKTIFSWNKINSDMFIKHLQRNLYETDSTNVNSTVNSITTCLQIAAQKSLSSKTLSFKGPNGVYQVTFSKVLKLSGKPIIGGSSRANPELESCMPRPSWLKSICINSKVCKKCHVVGHCMTP